MISKKSETLALVLLLAMGCTPVVAHAQNAGAAADQNTADMSQPVQVFILLGQSNMVGAGKVHGNKDFTLRTAVDDGLYPYLELLAKDEKAGRGAMIPLRADLVDALRTYIDRLQTHAGVKALRHDTHLFPMPKDMIRVFDRDLVAASIPKRDPRIHDHAVPVKG